MTRSLAPEHVIGHALRLPANSAGRPGSPEHDRSVMRLTSPPVPVFSLESVRFDEDYRPLDNTRTTTNFANLARGENRKENLRNAIRMIDNRFNELAASDNDRRPLLGRSRYRLGIGRPRRGRRRRALPDHRGTGDDDRRPPHR